MKVNRLPMLLIAAILAVPAVSQTEEPSIPEPKVISLTINPVEMGNYMTSFFFTEGTGIYNLRCRQVATVKGVTIKSLKLNPAGSSCAFVDVDKKGRAYIRINDLWEADHEFGKIKGKTYDPTVLCYSADSKKMFVACTDDSIRIYDTKKYLPRDSYHPSVTAEMLYTSGNGYYLVITSGNSAEVMNIEQKTVRKKLTMNATIKDVAFSYNNAMMAVLTEDGHCAVYDTRTFELHKDYAAVGIAKRCYFHPENKYLAVVTGEQRVAFINLLNEKNREYLDTPDGGIRYLTFNENSDGNTYLSYNTTSALVFQNVSYLSPNRTQILSEELKSRLDEWMKRMDGETLEEYNARVNDESRMAQIRLLETEIATGMAGNPLAMSEISLGNYNPEMGMLAIELGDMSTIYLSVPYDQLDDFMDVNFLEFTNNKYCLNEFDEFDLVYSEVINKKNGQTYIFDNTERKSLAFLSADDNFVPLEQIQQQQMEELMLAEIRNTILNEAREQNIVSEHTHIDVNTKVVIDNDADGNRITNYEVGVSYNVDEGYSAQDDFAPGKFKAEESNAAKAMLEVVKQALEGDLSKYVVEGKKVKIMVTGMADATPYNGTSPYDGTYGDFENEPYYKSGQLSNITVTKATGISNNDQLAFLRAMGVKNYVATNIPSLSSMATEYNANIVVSSEKGSEYRRIGVQLTFIDAL